MERLDYSTKYWNDKTGKSYLGNSEVRRGYLDDIIEIRITGKQRGAETKIRGTGAGQVL